MEKLGSINLSGDILRKASIGLWAFELDEGRPPRMYVDDTMAGLLGMTEALSPEDTYHAWYDHVDAEHYALVSAAVEKMTAGLHAEVQYPWHHPNGRTVWVRCGGVRNAAYTRGVRIEGCHRDVSDLIHFQHEEKRHVAETLDLLRAATWRCEVRADGSVTTFSCSENAGALLGNARLDSARITRAYVRDRIHPDDFAMVRDTFRRMVLNPSATGFELDYRMRCGEDAFRWFRAYARCRREDGVAHVYGVFIDINDAHEKAQLTERLSRALAEAKAAERTKTSFLATMSHEIRTPLNAVIGFADFLQDPTLQEDERRRYLTGITRSSHALLSLINDILDLSKIDAGKVVVRGGVCQVAKLLDEMKSIFHFNAAQKGIEIGSEISENFPAVALKEERVRQILLNLVGNAVKFTNRGRVLCKAVWRPTAPGRGAMTIQVRDTGIGIPKSKQAEIFNPFVQGDNVRGGQVYQGTGLGLPICRRLVEAVGGTISVESAVGRGTTFTVEIPEVEVSEGGDLLVETVVDPGLADIALESPKQVQVVAVDDVPLNLVVIEKFCEKAGVPKSGIKTFLRAREALAYLEDGGAQARLRTVVFTDMWMPEMTGEAFVRSVRANDALQALPVVAVTADAETSGSYDMSLFDEIITKPITGAKVKSALARLSVPAGPGGRRKIRYVL